jgi:predicted ATPase with chaperone activity
VKSGFRPAPAQPCEICVESNKMTSIPKQFPMEWDGAALTEAPTAPENLKEAGLTLGFVNEMILRTLYTHGSLLGLDLSRQLCLPFKVIEESLRFLKDEKCVDVTGGDLIGRISYRFALTELGRTRAQDAMQLCAYVGPAPVPLDDYVEQTYRQAVTGINCTPDVLRACFNHLVIPDALLNAIGPAVVSGRSIFIYGPPGNGKTSIARAIGDFMNDSGGEIYVPYAFLAENSIVTVYDQAIHQLSEDAGSARVEDNEATIRRLLNTGTVDARWVKVRRPVVTTGGELNLAMLDLRHNADANFYQAPLHVKANGGVFLIDDFGRQLCSPKELLNRWILPLEDRHDYLTIATGKKFEVPFEQLTIFSTNLDPRQLVDDAFLRRIRHKVPILAPDREVYERIFIAMARKLGMNPCPPAVDYLYERYYNGDRNPRASDCRDLLETVQAICRYRKQPVQLTRDLMVEASSSFIAEF